MALIRANMSHLYRTAASCMQIGSRYGTRHLATTQQVLYASREQSAVESLLNKQVPFIQRHVGPSEKDIREMLRVVFAAVSLLLSLSFSSILVSVLKL